jgi:hypothetical protein
MPLAYLKLVTRDIRPARLSMAERSSRINIHIVQS